MKTVTLRNDFHHTEVSVRPDSYGEINASQWRRVRRTLCGMADCQCGVVRPGKQIEQIDYNRWMIRTK